MSYVGVDLCRTRVFDWLQKYGGPDLLCDCHFLPFRSMQFDLVYCAALFEHVACPVLVMMEVARVLKQGGYFLGNCAFLEPWHDSSFCHMSPLAAIEALTAAGLDVDYVWPGRGYHAFRSIPAMCYLGPLKLLAHLGWIPYGLYWLQSRARAVARRLLSRDGVPDVFDRAVVSGATDWIAHRPVAYHCSALAP
jgi:SAM-dependent methyltransferase